MVAPPDTPRLAKLYKETVAPKTAERFELRNVHQRPRLIKIVVNCGVGRFQENQKLKPEIRDAVTATLTTITGQRPVIVKAKKSVSNFKVREGAPSGFVVTLRRDRMWHFLERLINLTIPRIRDFRGLRDKFDGRGNYSMGLQDQIVFPEVNPDKVEYTQGMNITMTISGNRDDVSRQLLAELGMPFRRPPPREEEGK